MAKLFYNGSIYTMSRERPCAENILVKEGKIAGIDVDRGAVRNSDLIDLEGRTVLPGFNDSHMHMLSYGISLDMLDLRDVTSIEEVISRGRKYIEERDIEEGQWIFGRGWNQENFKEKRIPRREDLDKITTGHPLILTRACGHMFVINSRALKACGITTSTDIEGGEIFKDKEGQPTGILTENAKKFITDNQPRPTSEDIERYLKLAAAELRKVGLTTVQSDDLTATNVDWQLVLDVFYRLADRGELKIRVNEQQKLTTVEDIVKLVSDNPVRRYADNFTLGPLKIIADGSLGARTAALREPYQDDPSRMGELIFNRRELEQLITCGWRNNMQVACHAIGDRTIELFLEIIENLQAKYGNGLRNRIIHCQITDYDLIKKMARYNVLADVQPAFTATDWGIVEDRLGKKRAINTYAWKTLKDEGINVAGGSDCPVENPHPLQGIRSAVTRVDWNDEPQGGWIPAEKLTVYEALEMFTVKSAHACFMENKIGKIKQGMAADLVILDQDPYLVDPLDLDKIPIYGTAVNGDLELYE